MPIEAAVGELDLRPIEPEEQLSEGVDPRAGVPELVDEGAVTRVLTVEDVITNEYVAAEPEPEPNPIEPSNVVELGDDVIARLTPIIEPFEPEIEEERVTNRFEPAPRGLQRLRSSMLMADAGGDPRRGVQREPTPVRLRSPERPTTVVGLIRPNGAVILLGLLCALAIVESIAAFLAYREHLAEDDWDAVGQLLADREHEPVIVASEWLGPSARMHLPQARSWDSLAFPDLRGFERFWLLTHAGERPWRGSLKAELEELPRPELLAVHSLGALTLHEYRQPVGIMKFSALDSIESVSTERGRCSGAGGEFRCKDGRVSVRLLEVDYRTRRCIAVELDDGVMATIELGKVELGDRIYGHVGFGDFNARLRADPSARLEVRINDVIAGRWVFTDDQGWATFALATEPGRHEVELRVGTTVGGTWQREGHRSSPTDVLCVELRGFDESGLEREQGA